MQNRETKKQSIIILWVLLAVSLGFNAFQYLNFHNLQQNYNLKLDSLLTSSVDLEKELNDTYSELNQYKGISTRLDSLLTEANSKVDLQKGRIELLIHEEHTSASLNKKLQTEMAALKKLREEYLEKIDALLVENEQLKKEKNDLTSTVETLTKNLESTVTTAGVLKSEYYNITAYKKRSNNKYAPTAIAKRTNKIEVCFTLLENTLAKPGTKNIYLRIVEPGGKVLGNRSTGSSTFRKSGSNEDILFTSTIEVDYLNAKQNICLNWEDMEHPFSSGTFMVEIYVDGAFSGASSINLR